MEKNSVIFNVRRKNYNYRRICPETNAIEEYFSQLKHYIKKESPNTYEDIYNTIQKILANKITKTHLTNYLKHSYKIYK